MRLIIAFLVVVIIYSLQYELYKKYWDHGLRVKLDFSENVVSCDEKVELVEVIENDKPLALPILNVKFATSRSFDFAEEENSNVSDMYYRNDIFSILGNQRIERRLEFTTGARGVFSIKELQVSSRDLFLKHSFAHINENDTVITVLPRRISMENFIQIRNQIMGDFFINRWDNPDPFAFRGIRPYQSFDTMGSINWKASARMNELMVNQYQATTENEVRIYLNLRPYMKSQADVLAEHAIRIASTVAADYIDHGVRVSLYTNGWDIDSKEDDDTKMSGDKTGDVQDRDDNINEGSSRDKEHIEALPPHFKSGTGREHLKALDIYLARLDIRRKPADMMKVLQMGFDTTEGEVTHVIISTYRDDALYGFFESHMDRESVYWIIPEREGNEAELRFPGMFRWDV